MINSQNHSKQYLEKHIISAFNNIITSNPQYAENSWLSYILKGKDLGSYLTADERIYELLNSLMIEAIALVLYYYEACHILEGFTTEFRLQR